jgi:hypothetical protein
MTPARRVEKEFDGAHALTGDSLQRGHRTGKMWKFPNCSPNSAFPEGMWWYLGSK